MAAGEIKDIIFTGADVSKISVTTGSQNTTLGSVLPNSTTGGDASKWLRVRVEGVDYYIPMWT